MTHFLHYFSFFLLFKLTVPMISPWRFLETILLVLQFDGSLRPPRDAGFPTKKLGRLASCGAALLSDDRRTLALGGKTFPLLAGMTSADAEFEGLLLGLEFLCTQTYEDGLSLLVEGDCKAVIDLMNQDAIPRKVQQRYNAAMRYLSKLDFADIKFQHIMRENNQLCDSVCSEVMHFAVEQVVLEMKAGLESQSLSVSEALTLYFDDSSLIPFSQRLTVYDAMLEHVREIGDGSGLKQLGQQLEGDAKLWPTDCQQSLTTLAIRIQIEGYELLGRKKEPIQLRRKHRFVLDKYAQQSESELLAQEAPQLPSNKNSPTPAMTSWTKKARDVFLTGESMRHSRRNVWITTSK
jgi:ribonuclease HI